MGRPAPDRFKQLSLCFSALPTAPARPVGRATNLGLLGSPRLRTFPWAKVKGVRVGGGKGGGAFLGKRCRRQSVGRRASECPNRRPAQSVEDHQPA
eukprot:15001876-Alexandrium_andersonii.AAC.1